MPIPVLKTNILFENRKRKVFEISEHLPYIFSIPLQEDDEDDLKDMKDNFDDVDDEDEEIDNAQVEMKMDQV